MTMFIAILFSLVGGSLAWNFIRLNYFPDSNVSPLIYYGALILTYILAYSVGQIVGVLVWGATLVAFRIVLLLVIVGLAVWASMYIYEKITGKQLFTFGRKSTDDHVQDAEIVEVVDYKQHKK